MTSYNENSIEKLRDLLEGKKIHPREILENCRKKIESTESCMSALNRTTYEAAFEKLDAWCYESTNQFCGIPYIQKDNICTSGIETDCSSRILKGFKPPYAATADARLREAGFRLMGKSNMDEFGMGSSTEYSAWGATSNPYDTSRVPGGSSGGSAAGVAAGYAVFALGSDTGGSVRQPAAFCGLVGLRPTYGRVSRWGLIAFASSLDQIGPITTTVRDSAHVLSIIQGQDEYDSTLVHREREDYFETIEDGVEGLRVGILDQGLKDWVDPRVRKVFDANVEWFKSRAKMVKEIHLDTFDLLLSAYYIIAPSEASSNLARFDGVRFGPSVGIASHGKPPDEQTASGLLDYYRKNRGHGFGPEVTRRILLGTFALSSGYYDAYYVRAQKVRAKVKAEFDELWREYDVIISPTAPTPPFKLGAKVDDPMDMYKEDVFVLPQPMAGCPAISINGGWTTLSDDNLTPLSETREKDCTNHQVTKLPIGLQITAKPFGEATLLRAARAFEREHA
jgi:aspartyl-tRNA(Asn)/glutamyl-tRNA(Gln) amidotransferase subunit A